jgi:hypothetical protein
VSRRPQQRRQAPRPVPLPAPEPEDDPGLDEQDDELYEDDDAAPAYTDADAFFAAEVLPTEPDVLRLYGTDYTLPVTVPLAFSLLAERHRDDDSVETLRTVLAPVFGAGALDDWLKAGIDQRRLGIVLLWSAQNMHRPGSLAFADAVREYDQREARGKALNRAQRRAGSGPRY